MSESERIKKLTSDVIDDNAFGFVWNQFAKERNFEKLSPGELIGYESIMRAGWLFRVKYEIQLKQRYGEQQVKDQCCVYVC